MVVLRLPVPRQQRRLAGLSLLLLLTGCHSNSAVTPPLLPASSVRNVRAAASASTARVQSLPLYKQAKRACRQHQYRQAADLLDRLSTSPDLTPAELTFCRQQRDLCLRDAEGKPALPVVSAPVSVAASADAECGPRALAFVCRLFGKTTTVEQLHTLAGTTAKGTSMEGLAKAAQATGLKAEGVQMSREALAQLDTPALAWVNQNHYVSVLRVDGEGEGATATIHDPNSAQEATIPQERLLRWCGGYLLTLRK